MNSKFEQLVKWAEAIHQERSFTHLEVAVNDELKVVLRARHCGEIKELELELTDEKADVRAKAKLLTNSLRRVQEFRELLKTEGVPCDGQFSLNAKGELASLQLLGYSHTVLLPSELDTQQFIELYNSLQWHCVAQYWQAQGIALGPTVEIHIMPNHRSWFTTC